MTRQQVPSISTIKQIKNLGQKKFRQQNGLFVVEGEKMVSELLESALVIEGIYATERWSGWPDENALRVSAKDLQRMSQLTTASHVLAVVQIPENTPDWDELAKSRLLFLDHISDPGNMGTIIRTAEWFGIKGVLLPPGSVDPFNPKVVQASMGSIFRMPLYTLELPLAIEILKGRNADFAILAAAMQGANTKHFSWPNAGALITGNESEGLSPDLLPLVDHAVHIPGSGAAESLNASVATAICCYAWQSI